MTVPRRQALDKVGYRHGIAGYTCLKQKGVEIFARRPDEGDPSLILSFTRVLPYKHHVHGRVYVLSRDWRSALGAEAAVLTHTD